MSDHSAIVAHDAGGAEVLASHVRRLPPQEQQRCLFSLEGPALKVFARSLPRVRPLPLEQAVGGAARLLCGSGWQSDLELRAIALSRQQGKRSAAWLDHWVNYRARFVRAGATVLPDEVWVGDTLALDRARAELPEVPARLVENPYFLDLREQIAARTVARPRASGPGMSILFVCEPVREHALRQHGNERHWGYTEEEALAYFLGRAGALGTPIGRIVVRPHPAEAPGKYAEVLQRTCLPVELSTQADVLDDVLASDWVAGCNSMVLVIALLAQRRVLCCIPPGGRPCVLPHAGIVQLQALAAGGPA